ncbi:GNAT family N-acetyltransferase [Candidatus Fermentibacteria bacterium]|nr:MAG: GNAT family N-acetyltransferase [Candidatus Fermentibacteria bacterium]
MNKEINISKEASLCYIEQLHAKELFELTDINREYLKQWLPWLDYVKSESDTLKFIKKAIAQNENSLGPTFVILYKNRIGGVIGYHPFDNLNKIGEIGYWLSQSLQGKGIITLSCKALIKLGFEMYRLNRIQIPAAENNGRSRLVPERLGFKYEGMIREREFLYGKYVNHAMYSILKSEYSENS